MVVLFANQCKIIMDHPKPVVSLSEAHCISHCQHVLLEQRLRSWTKKREFSSRSEVTLNSKEKYFEVVMPQKLNGMQALLDVVSRTRFYFCGISNLG